MGRKSRSRRGKGGRESFHFCFGRPRGCSVASSPSRFAMPIIQSSLPKGRPRCALDRRSSSSDVLSGSFSNLIQFCGRSIGHELKNSSALHSAVRNALFLPYFKLLIPVVNQVEIIFVYQVKIVYI